jgi:hypothetical protein
MARRGPADGSRLLGWDRVRARDRARHAAHRDSFRVDPAAWLKHFHARVVPPNAQHPYWIVQTTAGVYLGAGSTVRRAVLNARTRLRST